MNFYFRRICTTIFHTCIPRRIYGLLVRYIAAISLCCSKYDLQDTLSEVRLPHSWVSRLARPSLRSSLPGIRWPQHACTFRPQYVHLTLPFCAHTNARAFCCLPAFNATRDTCVSHCGPRANGNLHGCILELCAGGVCAGESVRFTLIFLCQILRRGLGVISERRFSTTR